MGRLFGTDGARGIANTELTCELAMGIGRAAAYVLTKQTVNKPKIIIGMDTRMSSEMLQMALAAGMCSFGADVVLAGYVPTPAIAFLVSEIGADAGVMISASHNPCEYNGIKIFDKRGYKLPDSVEEEIEAIVLDNSVSLTLPTGGEIGSVYTRHDYVELYIDHVVNSVDPEFNLNGMKIAIDCAHGCASYTAKKIFGKLGAECHFINCEPDGININEHCGSTHMGELVDFVNKNQMDLGLAFDGDSDRCLAIDEKGRLIDGDNMIAIFAKELKNLNKLNNNTAVVTVMTNIGFKKFAKNNDINVVETGVGDRYVLEELVKNDFSIGGEQSGHIIFREFATTGDGQLSGLQLACAMKRSGKKASEVASVMTTFPQVLINITVNKDGKDLLNTDEIIINAIKNVSEKLGDSGRVLVRASGTEPLIRVMIEGEEIEKIKIYSEEIAKTIRERISK